MPQSASLPLTTYSTISPAARLQLAQELMAVVGQSNTRLIIAPAYTDTTTTTDLSPNAYTCTWDATIAARLSQLGMGENQSYNGTTQYGSVPDADNLSFGNGTTDSAFSGFVLVNPSSTAAQDNLIVKWDSTSANPEYAFVISNAAKPTLYLADKSAGVFPSRAVNAGISTGSLLGLGFSYSGLGGATAANGITLYKNGSVAASTAGNGPAYVAMENLTSAVGIGAWGNGTSAFLPGSMALSLLVAAELSAAQHASIVAIINKFYGLSLS